MSTIQKILSYNFNREERRKLYKLWFVNWCWGKWGENFDEILKVNIKFLKNFDPYFLQKLLDDIKKICEEHDLDYQLLRNAWFWFFRANFRMALKLFRLIHWTSIWWRISLASIVFVLLQKYGKRFFNWSVPTTLENIYSKLYASENLPHERSIK